ncbi:hypothetical protein K493DRAFT_337254 [Basidiobolus meristosporus CBS 931.73]|uniref:DUF2470 domain-containing protein n=1 Tax=Basidiobolus meristosporus CBS 931.73 TaxID=1314790 RepID=A0A1Y1YCB4_9FUNG|nr:hypothetical protein K493DRAFT_337254 [Basidiobolus meristosporus CBS 931.73]|eukprot:ORX95617.1 hypothetical protein K493DRAFT_337254 [Basidiobolus meristosporus CBS 931.73]
MFRPVNVRNVPRQDSIANSSETIVAHMNEGHAEELLMYGKFFGECKQAVSATLVDIDQSGLTIVCLTEEKEEEEIRIAFRNPVPNKASLKEALDELTEEAAKGLGVPVPGRRGISKKELGSDGFFILPDPNHALIVLFAVISYTYLVFSSNPIWPLNYLKLFFGQGVLNALFAVMVLIHAAEAFVAWAICLTRPEYDNETVMKWVISTFIFGIGSLRKLFAQPKKKSN